MTPYQKLIDEIVLMVNDDRLYSPGDVEPFANEYRTAVKEINQRLLFCDDLLQKGYRSEVVQESDRVPNLLDSVAILDFPDLELFRQTVTDLQLQPLPSIRVDIASDVNECYAGNNLVDRLLRQFRVASLALSPIEHRLTLLRKLHTLDGSNLGWAEDVLIYERARISQIQKEIQIAVNSEDLSKLNELYSELTSPEWQEKPPSTIARSIESTIEKLELKVAKRNGERLIAELQSAFQEQDFDRCKEIKQSVNALMDFHPQAIGSDQASFLGQVESMIVRSDNILKTERDYKNLLLQLDEALDNRDSYEKIERLASSIQRLEKPVSNDRLLRIRALKDESETQSRRKFTLIIAASVILLLIAGFSGNLIYQSKLRERLTKQYDENLATMIQNMRLNEALKEIERIENEEPVIAINPLIVKRRTDLAAAIDQEQQRVNSFEAILEQITGLLRNAGDSLTELSKAEVLVNNAKELSREPSEKAQLDEFLTIIVKTRSALQKKFDDKFLSEFKPLQEKSENKMLDIDSAKNIMTQLSDLKQRSVDVRSELVRLIDPVTGKIQSQIEEMENNAKEKNDRDRLIGSFASLSKYLEGLKQFVQIQPRSGNAAKIRTILEGETQIWLDLESFGILQNQMNSLQLSRLKVSEANKILNEWKKYEKRLDFHPSISKAPELFGHVSKVANRGENPETSLTSKMFGIEALGHPLIQNAKYICDKSQTVYYLANPPTINSSFSTYSIRMYLDTDLRRTQVFGIQESTIDKSRSSAPAWDNPIRLLSGSFSDSLKKVEGKAWDALIGRLIFTLQSDPRVDDFQKFRCLSAILPLAMEGSYYIEMVYAEHMRMIKGANIDLDINWANPQSNELLAAKSRISNLLRSLPDAANTRDALNNKIDASQKFDAGRIFNCAGALILDSNQKWNLIFAANGDSLDGDLFVIDSSGSKPVFVKCGTKAGKRLEIDQSKENYLSEFKVVWVMTEPSK